MKRIELDCTFDLADKMIECLENITIECPVVAAYGKYKIIKELLEDLIMSGIPIADEIELHDYEVDYYDKEFVLYLKKDGINVEKCWSKKNEHHGDIYLFGCSDMAFIHEDCSSKIIDKTDATVNIEFGIKFYDKNEFDCTDCECKSGDDSGNTFNISIKGNLDLDETYTKLDEIESRILHMSEMFDEMMNFSKLLGFGI